MIIDMNNKSLTTENDDFWIAPDELLLEMCKWQKIPVFGSIAL